MKVILGDNQFFGINHHDLNKGDDVKNFFKNEQSVFEFIKSSLEVGLDGFMINSNQIGYNLINNYKFDELKEIHYSIPYPHKYAAIINTSGLLTAITDGTVTVTATANDASGITGSKVISISNQSLGVNEQTNTSNLSIYPNPVNAQLTISSEDKIGTIVILNVMGKTVKTITSSSNTIDVSELTKGIYFLKIQMDKGLVSEKFIKE